MVVSIALVFNQFTCVGFGYGLSLVNCFAELYILKLFPGGCQIQEKDPINSIKWTNLVPLKQLTTLQESLLKV